MVEKGAIKRPEQANEHANERPSERSSAIDKLFSDVYGRTPGESANALRQNSRTDADRSVAGMGFPNMTIVNDARSPQARAERTAATGADAQPPKADSYEQNTDYRGKGGPAAIRYNNPGAMYPGESARKFGSTTTHSLRSGAKIAEFKDAVHGAAAELDLLASNKYSNLSVKSAIDKWCGHHGTSGYLSAMKAAGIDINAKTGDIMGDKNKAITLASAMARFEAGKEYPLSKEQWSKAFDLYSQYKDSKAGPGQSDAPDKQNGKPEPRPNPEPGGERKPEPRPNTEPGGERKPEQPPERKPDIPTDRRTPTDSTSQVYKLHLPDGSGQRTSADAVIRVPGNFDPKKPINLLVYNHGWYDSAESAYKNAELEKQMANAPPNTVLIVPEWQSSPAAANGNQGRFSEPGTFKNMVQEAFAKTPGLEGKTLADVSGINIIAHSAGYGPTETEIYKNGLGDKVKSISLLDALYDGHGFDRWIKDNIKDIGDGKKQFTNIYSGTSAASQAQAERIKGMLAQAGYSADKVWQDSRHPNDVLTPEQLAGHSIVFKYSTATDKVHGAHMSLPNLYVGLLDNRPTGDQASRTGFQVQPTEWQRPAAPERTDVSRANYTEEPSARVVRSADDLKNFYRFQDDGHSCSAFSMAMLVSDQTLGRPVNYGKEAQSYKALAGTLSHGYRGDLQSIANKLESAGLDAKAYRYDRVGNQTMEDLNKELDQGHTAVARVINPHTGNPHYIYVAGRDAKGNYIVGDPDRYNKKHFSPVPRAHLQKMMSGRDGFVAGWSKGLTQASIIPGTAAYRYAVAQNNPDIAASA